MKTHSKEEFLTLTRQILSGKLAATITHKAKNILMPITGYIELIESGVSAEKERDYFKKIECSGHTLQLLLKRFLRFSTPSQKKEREEVDISELLEDVISLFEHYIAMAKIGLEKCICPETAKAWGVYNDISIILASLILNAIESSPRGGKIRIATEVVDDRVDISVDDDGPGIGEDIRGEIFKPFFTTKRGSLGLGLTISSLLAKDMSGQLILEGKSRFILSLCRKRY